MTNPAPQKVDQALQYRWGVVGIVLVIGLMVWFWKARPESTRAFLEQSDATKNLDKIACPRCNNEEPRKKDCSLCGGKGFIWVDTTKDQPRPPAPK